MHVFQKKAPLDRAYFISALLTAWEAEGYALGTGKHLQIQTLLEKLPDELENEQLKTYLAPLLAHDAQRQKDFYRIFEQTLDRCGEQMHLHQHFVGKEIKAQFWYELKKPFLDFGKKMRRRWDGFAPTTRLLLAAGGLPILLGLLGCLCFFLFLKNDPPPKIEPGQDFTVFANLLEKRAMVGCFEILNPRLGEIVRIERQSAMPKFVLLEEFFNPNSFCFQYKAVKKGREQVQYRVCFSSGSCFNFNLIFRSDFYQTVVPKISSAGGAMEIRVAPDKQPTPLKPTDPQLPNIAVERPKQALDTNKNQQQQQAGRLTDQPSKYASELSTGWHFGTGYAYFSWAKAVLAALVALLLFLLGRWWRYKNQKFTLQQQSGKNPPYAWTIRVPNGESVGMGDQFYLAVTEMRRRSEGETRRFDLPSTIKKTLKNGGMVDFQYKNQFRNKDYLLLLDLHAPQNQRTRLFKHIVESLLENEVPLEVFYFDNDPRLCWNERHPHGISLREIQHRFREHQLVVWGTAHFLLQNSNGQLAGWTQTFDHWQKKAILTPRSAADWDRREAALAQKFRLLPASPDGLAALVENLEAVEPKNYLLWRDHPDELLEDLVLPQRMRPPLLLQILEAEFVQFKNGQRDDRLLRWVAACALPPVLFWDWMLYVGQRLGLAGEQFLNLQNLYKITRLPWFADGRMPESVRSVLLAWLEREHPQLDIALRHEWQKIMNLEENLPPVGSLAWQGHRVQVILNELLEKPNWRKRRQLELELDNLLLNPNDQDALVIKYLDRRRSPLDNVLSDRFRKFVQEKRGIVWRWRDWTWQVGGTALVFLLSLFVRVDEPVRVFRFEELFVSDLSFAPGDSTFLMTDGDGSASICRTDGGWVLGSKKAELPQILTGSFDAEGNSVAVLSSDGTVKIWDIGGAPLESWQLKSSSGLIRSADFSPDLGLLLLGFYGGGIEIWDVPRRKLSQKLEATHRGAVEEVAFSPNGRMFLSCGQDNSAVLWTLDKKSDFKMKTRLVGHQKSVLSGAFSPDGNSIATADFSGKLIVWDRNGKQTASWQAHGSEVSKVCFSSDGQSVFSGGFDKTVRRWRLDGQLLRVFEGQNDRIFALTVAADGKKLLVGSADGFVRLWFLKK